MTAINGNSIRLECCYCGAHFIIPDCAAASSFGMESIICPHCGMRGHRVAECNAVC